MSCGNTPVSRVFAFFATGSSTSELEELAELEDAS